MNLIVDKSGLKENFNEVDDASKISESSKKFHNLHQGNYFLLIPADIHNLIINYIPYALKFKCRLISKRYNRLILPHLNSYYATNDIQLSKLLKSEMFPFIEKLYVDRLVTGHTQKSQILTGHTIIEVVSHLLKRKGKVEACITPYYDNTSLIDDRSLISDTHDGLVSQNFFCDKSNTLGHVLDSIHTIQNMQAIQIQDFREFSQQKSLDIQKVNISNSLTDNVDEDPSMNEDESIDSYSIYGDEANYFSETFSTGHSIMPQTDDCTFNSGADFTMDSIDEEFCTNAFVTRDIQLTELHIKYFNLNFAGKMTRDHHDTMFLKILFTLCGEEISQQVQKLTILTLDLNDEAIGKYIVRYSNSIKELNLWGNTYITSASIMHLVYSDLCKNLTRLEIGAFGISITDYSIDAISECMPQLEHLNLCRCSAITDRSVGKMATKLKNLITLDLGFIPNITDISVSKIIENITGLESLGLRRCSVSENGLKDIYKLKKLKEIELSETQLTSIEFLKNVSETLESLELDRCEKLVHLDALYSLSKLKRLSLSHYFKVDDAKIEQISKHLKKLEYFEICCGRLNDEAFVNLSKINTLRYLYLHFAYRITDFGFISLCDNLNRLETFVCSRCEHVKVEAITHLKNLKRLKMLDLTSQEIRKHMFDDRLSFFLKIPHVRL